MLSVGNPLNLTYSYYKLLGQKKDCIVVVGRGGAVVLFNSLQMIESPL